MKPIVKQFFVYLWATSTCLSSAFALAEGAPSLLGNDFISRGDLMSISSDGVDDVFAIGRKIDLQTAITGSAHIIASDVSIDAEISNSFYAIGDHVDITATIGTDVLVMGKSIDISAAIGGDLRGVAETINVDAAVGGDIQFGGESIIINGPIAGTVALSAEHLTFGTNAHIVGDLILYGASSAEFDIPTSVISADRIVYRTSSHIIDQEFLGPMGAHTGNIDLGTFHVLLVAVVLTSLIVIFAKGFTKNAYGRAWLSVMVSIGYGFVGLSLLIGSIIISALTFIGIPLSIFLVIATLGVAIVGYWMGSYFIGARIWLAARGEIPNSVFSVVLAVTLGLVCAGLMSAIPWLGWWLTMTITLFGVGAISPWRGKRVKG